MGESVAGRGCRIVLALLVSHRAKLWASTITHPCVCGRLGRRVLAPTLCDRHRASLHDPHSASSPPSTKKSRVIPVCGSKSGAGLSNCGRLGRRVLAPTLCDRYRASMHDPQVACSPSRRTKNNTPLVERGIIFGADGGGRTRTVLLPTDFESVTSANSITPANMLKFCTYISLTHFLNGFKRENHIILKI